MQTFAFIFGGLDFIASIRTEKVIRTLKKKGILGDDCRAE